MNTEQLVAEKEEELRRNIESWVKTKDLLGAGEMLEVAVSINKKLAPIVEVNIQLPDDTSTFYIRGKAYSRRQLTPEELAEIAQRDGPPWKKAVVNFLVKNGNQDTPIGELITISRKNGYGGHGVVALWGSEFNSYFLVQKDRSYRLTHAHFTRYPRSKETLFRFYREEE